MSTRFGVPFVAVAANRLQAPLAVAVAILTTAILATTALAAGSVVEVANNGVDSGTCGASTAPCRSITKAITNAPAGSTIQVGPGVYGDLDGSGTLGDSPGEEVPSAKAMIDVTKQLTIVSRDGAGSTVLDAAFAGGGKCLYGPTPGASCSFYNCYEQSTCGTGAYCAPVPLDVVRIDAASVVFGKPKHGFTLTHSSRGLGIEASTTAQGNIADSNCWAGFGVDSASGTVLSGNVAVNNGEDGFDDYGTSTTLKGNLSKRNGSDGIYASGGSGGLYTKNVLVENYEAGAEIDPTGSATSPVATFSHNAIVGNPSLGLSIYMYDNFLSDVSIVLEHNDYFGNGENGSNCGIQAYVNDFNATPHTLSITSKADFWGAAGGPGADPADNAGGVCNSTPSGKVVLNVVKPAAKEIKITPPTIQ